MKYIYTNEETDAVSIHECLIKNICFGKFETRIYIDWSQGYGSFVVKCAYPSMVEYNFTTISDDEFRDCHRMVLNHLRKGTNNHLLLFCNNHYHKLIGIFSSFTTISKCRLCHLLQYLLT